jgi:Tfp pilus assembly protein PilF
MKSTMATLSVLVALLVSGCAFLHPEPEKPTNNNPNDLLQWGIVSYNSGNIDEAKTTLTKVLKLTKGRNAPNIRAEAHLYLAAVAWDLGQEDVTDRYLRECRSINPHFKPDWTFFSPSLRKRFEALAPAKKNKKKEKK